TTSPAPALTGWPRLTLLPLSRMAPPAELSPNGVRLPRGVPWASRVRSAPDVARVFAVFVNEIVEPGAPPWATNAAVWPAAGGRDDPVFERLELRPAVRPPLRRPGGPARELLQPLLPDGADHGADPGEDRISECGWDYRLGPQAPGEFPGLEWAVWGHISQ